MALCAVRDYIDPMKTDLQKERDKLVAAALPDVAFDGWTIDTLQQAAKNAGLRKNVAGYFPGGVRDAIAHLFDMADRHAVGVVEKAVKKDKKMRIRDRIALGVQARLDFFNPHKAAISAALGYMAVPPHCLKMPRLLWRAADALWWAAGDTSTDYNHYTKRSLLSGVISATTLYWLNDRSPNNEQTWDFLDRRIENVLTLGKALGKLRRRG